MNKNVRKAVESLREEFGGDSYIPDIITVDADTLLTLLEWAEMQVADDYADTCALGVGDRVELKIDYLGKSHTREGAQGRVSRLLLNGSTFPFEVRFDGHESEYPVKFKRDELRKLTA